MNYCSFDDAFPQIGPTAPGCRDQKGSEAARKEERKKAKRCKGPPMTFLDLDPDRPAVQRVPSVPPLNKETGLREHAPVDAPQAEPFTDDVPYDLTSERQPDDAGQIARNTFPKVPKNTKLVGSSTGAPSYFGTKYSDEGFENQNLTMPPPPFTNVIGQDPAYSDLNSAFKQGNGVAKASALAPIPSVSDFWKPMTKSGANTSFYDELPPPGGQMPKGTPMIEESVSKKLDLLFARLDDLESRRGENTQTEILLFVMSGLFVLFSMDIVSRQAARIRLI
jgi:hypothetical protein